MMINIFKRKTDSRDIELFEVKVAKLIKSEFPQIEELLEKEKLKIYFSKTGILLMRDSFKMTNEVIKKSKNNFFELSGIYLFEKKTFKEKEIKLFYQNNVLNLIKVELPETFYKDFDLNSITKKDLKIRNIKVQNPDFKIVSKILFSLRKEQFELLELESTFEIEVSKKKYYPILDFENGNYIAVNKKGNIYRLQHDEKEDVKMIFNDIHSFLDVYNGNKTKLEIYFK
jgi:hypothetical protein